MFNEEVQNYLFDFLQEKVTKSFAPKHCYTYYEYADDDCGDDDYSFVADLCSADSYNSGVTKIVLFYNELDDWVIKIPIFGSYIEDENRYINFFYSGTMGGNDYCLTEVKYCENAVNSYLENCFAKTYFIGYINNVPFYCSEKIEKTYLQVYHPNREPNYRNKNSLAQAKILSYKYNIKDILDDKQLGYFIDSYGEKVTNRLINFLLEEKIEDLHYGNLGFDKNDNIKIIDCAGWRD